MRLCPWRRTASWKWLKAAALLRWTETNEIIQDMRSRRLPSDEMWKHFQYLLTFSPRTHAQMHTMRIAPVNCTSVVRILRLRLVFLSFTPYFSFSLSHSLSLFLSILIVFRNINFLYVLYSKLDFSALICLFNKCLRIPYNLKRIY